MIDVEPLIVSELDRLLPLPDGDRADWADVVGRAGLNRQAAATTPRDRSAVYRRRYGRAFVFVALVVVLFVAVGFSSGVRSLLGLTPKPSLPVIGQAALLVSASIGNGFVVHEWSAPSSSGGSCLYASVTRVGSPIGAATMNGGGACSVQGKVGTLVPTRHTPIQWTISATRRLKNSNLANWVPPFVTGTLDPRIHATRLTIRYSGGSIPLVLRGHRFAGGSRKLYDPPSAAFPFRIVAYNRAGQIVASTTLPTSTLAVAR
jgi:hypothetical protein